MLTYSNVTNKPITYDEKEGRLFGLGEYQFAWEDLGGDWIIERVWCEETSDALSEARVAADMFGTGRYRFYGSFINNDHSQWVDESHVLHMTKSAYAKVGRDFKGTTMSGLRSVMPPLCLGFTTCLLTEGKWFVIE